MYTLKGGKASLLLQRLEIDIIPNNICNAQDSYDGAVLDKMICAGTMVGGKDSCQVINPKNIINTKVRIINNNGFFKGRFRWWTYM